MSGVTTFTAAIGEQICARLADGESLRKICQSEEMPDKSTVFRWLADPANTAFRDQYARAREAQADALAEEILDIADDGSLDTYTDDDGNIRADHEVVARSKLRVDARKWLASKMAPKKYGDKISQEISGPDGSPIAHTEMTKEEFTEIASQIAKEV